jgi:hypothetical protein
MRKATKAVATWFGLAAGLAGLEHGYFEVLQGNIRPESLFFPSMGPPCDPEKVWNACEPALSVLPNFLISGMLTILISLGIIIWAVGFIQRKRGGMVLILLSIALLFLGGGIFPPLIGILGGVAGTKINRPLMSHPGKITHGVAKLWPWPLVILMVWLGGQFVVGYLANDFLASSMGFGLLLIMSLLPLSVVTAYAKDAVTLQATQR